MQTGIAENVIQGNLVTQKTADNRTLQADIPNNLYCGVCIEVVKPDSKGKARQCQECEHTLCISHYDEGLGRQFSERCCYCREDAQKYHTENQSPLFLDITIKTQVNNIIWHCAEPDCSQQGTLDVMDKHPCQIIAQATHLPLMACPHQDCDDRIEAKDFEHHKASCVWRTVNIGSYTMPEYQRAAILNHAAPIPANLTPAYLAQHPNPAAVALGLCLKFMETGEVKEADKADENCILEWAWEWGRLKEQKLGMKTASPFGYLTYKSLDNTLCKVTVPRDILLNQTESPIASLVTREAGEIDVYFSILCVESKRYYPRISYKNAHKAPVFLSEWIVGEMKGLPNTISGKLIESKFPIQFQNFNSASSREKVDKATTLVVEKEDMDYLLLHEWFEIILALTKIRRP